MPFIAIELAGTATREQKAAIVADVTRSMVERLGKAESAVQVVINEHPTTNYGWSGRLLDSAPARTPREDAPADVGQ